MIQRLLWFSVLIVFSACDSKVRMQATGYTQGTTYSIAYYGDGTDYQYQIDSLLLEFDRVLSTYQETSYISKWNRNEASSLPQPEMFKEVVRSAKQVHQQTNGRFDITVSPLMAYWFERDWSVQEPDSASVDSLMLNVGMDKVVLADGVFQKTVPAIQLDVNGIAQGYSVDVVARFLESKGIFDYLVEIGGEVRASGGKPDGDWMVGIDEPSDLNVDRQIALSIALKGRSMATSGNYRKYIEVDGKRLGHTLNPTSGYPVMTDVLSATVIADNCMMADAYATACLALGLEEAKKLIEGSEELDGILMYSLDEELQIWKSKALASTPD